jgi:hypothetical protein
MPTLLALVNQTLADMKQPPIITVANAKPLINVIVGGINDAIIDIYTRAKWQFRIASAPINMVSGQSDYLVPADFGSVEQDIVLTDKTIYYEPTGSFLGGMHSSGLPSMFTLIDADHFRFDPIPNDEFVAAWPQIMVVYLRRPVLVSQDGDIPNLPMEFQDALKAKARLRWKAAQEYSQSDLQMEEGLYEGMIGKKIASYLISPGKRQGMKPLRGNNVRTSFRRF